MNPLVCEESIRRLRGSFQSGVVAPTDHREHRPRAVVGGSSVSRGRDASPAVAPCRSGAEEGVPNSQELPRDVKGRKMPTKTKRRTRNPVMDDSQEVPTTTIFSSDLLTPEEERELLADFWETKSELVRVLLRNFTKLRQFKPALEPWPMAQFIRDRCDADTRNVPGI